MDNKSLAAGLLMEKHSNSVFQRSEARMTCPKSHSGCSPSQPNRIPGNPMKWSWMSYTPASPNTSHSFNSQPSFLSMLCPLVLEGRSSGINQDGLPSCGALQRGLERVSSSFAFIVFQEVSAVPAELPRTRQPCQGLSCSAGAGLWAAMTWFCQLSSSSSFTPPGK